jgi:hypothetical protein
MNDLAVASFAIAERFSTLRQADLSTCHLMSRHKSTTRVTSTPESLVAEVASPAYNAVLSLIANSALS